MAMHRSNRASVVVGLGLSTFAFLAGCGSADWVSVATGTVAFSDGAPVSWGMVELVPEEGGSVARGEIKIDGSFSLATGRRQGLQTGRYRAVIVQTIAPEMMLRKHHHPLPRVDRRFTSPETTPLVVLVSKGQPAFETPLVVERLPSSSSSR